MPGANKLLADLGGVPVLSHALRLARHPVLSEAVVVTGFDREPVAALARAAGLRTVHADDWEEGTGASLRAGVAATDAEADGVAILLGDVPLVRPATLDRLAEAFAARGGIVRPTHDGVPGHPVLFARDLRPALLAVQGDDGAYAVVRRHAARLHLVPTDDAGTTLDADTPSALDQLRQRLAAGR